jgi:hypothetical protein
MNFFPSADGMAVIYPLSWLTTSACLGFYYLRGNWLPLVHGILFNTALILQDNRRLIEENLPIVSKIGGRNMLHLYRILLGIQTGIQVLVYLFVI